METTKTQAIRYIDFDVYLKAIESNGATKVFADLDCRDSNGNTVVSLLKECELPKLRNQLPPYSTQANNDNDVVNYGRQLYLNLFDKDLREKFGSANGKNPPLVRIGISSQNREYPTHFWELICRENTDDFLSLNINFSIARILKHDLQPSNLSQLKGPLKILVGHANPDGSAIIPFEKAKKFKSIAEQRGHKAEVLGKLNFERIQNFFEENTSDPLHVVHLICHGKFINEGSCLIFVSDDGNRCNIDPSVLAQELKRVSPSLVILQACKSGETNPDSDSDFMTGVAETLVSHGIPSVLAFRSEPHIDFAFEFLFKFYDVWLKGGCSFEYALHIARLTIRNSHTNLDNLWPIDAWSLPVLYRQPGVFLEIRHTPGQDGSVTHPNTNDFFRKQVVNLLDGNKELTTILYNELFDRNKESNGIAIADYLISTNSTSTDEFPLRRFKRVLGSLVDKRTEINKDCSETLSLMTEILEIASFPTEDNQQIEKVMQEILNSNLGFSNSSELSTSKTEVAKKLLIASRFKLLSAEFSNLNVAQLFSKDMTDNKDFLRFSRKIHVVTEPASKPDDLTLIEFYSKACIDYLRYPHEGSQYQDDLQDILNENVKDGVIISLLISDEKTEAIRQLRDRFALLHVVELPRESISRYRAIDRDRMDSDKHLNVLRLPS